MGIKAQRELSVLHSLSNFKETIRRDNKQNGVMSVETSGASWTTSQQDRLGCSGVEASHTMAQTDRERMAKYRSKIISVGGQSGIEPALIAAIISRESRAGNH
ncbi:hypothetical protein F7725_006140 [Dissostichus mawsoni]|uniref:Lysozyme g n=1 Tax=Dissostichus mawsoni TaxID=36200 RepID=A0A7J5YTF0_DISMA|nr:hypothetical protein F7725_006131 [Dissostichus mawsoni]KAF3852785.1 hypothetical protein F7725_006140 [Dissostichus mawsoni]